MVIFLLDLIDLIDFLTLDLTCLIFGDWVIPTLILFMGTKFEIKEISIDCIIIHTNRKNDHSDEIRKLYAPFLADSDVDGVGISVFD